MQQSRKYTKKTPQTLIPCRNLRPGNSGDSPATAFKKMAPSLPITKIRKLN